MTSCSFSVIWSLTELGRMNVECMFPRCHATKRRILFTIYNICIFHVSSAYFITPPTSRSDWVQLSKLIVNCLAEVSPKTTAVKNDPTKSISTLVADIQWNLYQESISQQQIYQQLVQTARTMQGMKYTIIIAKERQSGGGGGGGGGGGKVIGMIELGVSMSSSSCCEKVASTVDSQGCQQQQMRRVMLGTICVDPQYRSQGIASNLIGKCESIAIQQWNETALYAHVEETNDTAIKLFTKLGYLHAKNNETTDFISVRRRSKVEIVPHLLYAKTLNISTYDKNKNTTTTTLLIEAL